MSESPVIVKPRKSMLPREFAKVELSVGDENDNGKVDVSAHVSILGKSFINFSEDVDLSTAFRVIGSVRDFGDVLTSIFGRK